MKIVYYSTPAYMDLSLMLVRELSKLAELHFLLEISPQSKKNNLLDITDKILPEGITDAGDILKERLPQTVQKYWQDCASFKFLTYNCSRSIHPSSWINSRKGADFITAINPGIINIDGITLRQAWSFRKLKKFPIIMSVHDPEVHIGEKNWREDLARWLTFPYVKSFLLHNKKQIEPFLKNYKLSDLQACSVPLGTYDIFREWEKEKKTDNGRTILFFGRISPYKGLDVLFRAAPHIAARIPGVRIIVAGRPVPGYNIPKPPDLDGKGTIEIINEYISNNWLADLFNSSTVVVCPYTDATQSGVVLTAYAFNKPVVASDTGGLPEYVRHMQTGLLVPPGDGHQLAAALTNVLSDQEMQMKFKNGIENMVKGELSWQNIARQTYNIYDKILRSM